MRDCLVVPPLSPPGQATGGVTISGSQDQPVEERGELWSHWATDSIWFTVNWALYKVLYEIIQSMLSTVNLVSSDDLVMTQSSANQLLIDSTQKINNQSQEPVSVPLSSLSFLPSRPILVVCPPTLSLIHLQTSPCVPRSPDH